MIVSLPMLLWYYLLVTFVVLCFAVVAFPANYHYLFLLDSVKL